MRPAGPGRTPRPRPLPAAGAPGLLYQPGWLGEADRAELLDWLATLTPLWEQRWSTVRGPPPGEAPRGLLRPVYWLGNWQFACLGYYQPPRGTVDRAVAAEPFPPVLARLAAEAERLIRARFPARDIPAGWSLDTCLVNFYGDRREGGRWVDVARVGDHRDDEPGPVASISLGERARFQFVPRGRGGGAPVSTTWLEDGSLQAFGGPTWKDGLLHRVQRVEDKRGLDLPPRVEGFRTRRINLTLRHVPPVHVVPYRRLGEVARRDVEAYVAELGRSSAFWRAAAATAFRLTPAPDPAAPAGGPPASSR